MRRNRALMSDKRVSALDDIDHELLMLLQANARRTNKELAEAVGIAQSTCLERIRALVSSGVILGWHADVDPVAMGRPIRAMISVRLQPKTTASVRAFQREMLEIVGVLAVSTVSGVDDFIVEVAVSDVGALRDFVLEHLTSRGDVVDARTALVYEQARRWDVRPAEK